MLKEINLYKEEYLLNNSEIINTLIPVNLIEKKINSILDKYEDICKYYIDIIDNIYWVSFNVGLDQIEALYKTMFSINIYRDIHNNSIILISKEINENHHWNELYSDLINKLKNN